MQDLDEQISVRISNETTLQVFSPKVIGHMEPCRAQFVILSRVDKTYSEGKILSREIHSYFPEGLHTSLILGLLKTKLIRTSLSKRCYRFRS
jgi:hypothetical protein